MRLDKALSLAGYTRSEAKAMIAKGRVRVGEQTVRDSGLNVRPEDVFLDGEAINAEEEIYLMIHKPAGVVTATEDKKLPRYMLRKGVPITIAMILLMSVLGYLLMTYWPAFSTV